MTQLIVPLQDTDHQTGPVGAPVTLVEYGDYECEHCAAAEPVVKAVKKTFNDRLNIVFRFFPLTYLHPNGLLAATAAEAAGEQGKFWEMHQKLFVDQEDLSPDSITEMATELDLDMDKFATDWESPHTKSRIEADVETGFKSGVNGTPTFFINNDRFDEPPSEARLTKAIQEAWESGKCL